MSKYTDIGVDKVGHVGTIEIRRPPLNFFDISLINQIADARISISRSNSSSASAIDRKSTRMNSSHVTSYDMSLRYCSSDVCSSDLLPMRWRNSPAISKSARRQ